MNIHAKRNLFKRRARILNMLRVMRRPLRLDEFATLSDNRSAPPSDGAVLAALLSLEQSGCIAREGDAWRLIPPSMRADYESRRERAKKAATIGKSA